MRKPILTTLILLFLIVIIFLSSCSLLVDEYNRLVGYNSICWEDNDHILVYAKIAAYDNYATVGGDMKNFIWGGGEIWRIDVNTGEKELVLRKKGPEYTITYEYAVITLQDTFRFISDWDTTFIMDENYDNWQPYGAYTYPQISEDGKEIVGLVISNEVETIYVKKFNLSTGEETILWETTDFFVTMDYDFDRNLLLLNNIRLVNLNTGLDTVLVKVGDEISGHIVYDTYYSRYGRLFNDNIITDIWVENDVYSKVYIDADSLSNRSLKYGLRGIPNPDGTKFAFGSDNLVQIQDINGNIITEIAFPNNEI
ncbi:MAG: hypothetical protein SVK54_08410 [candidate division WOR-3 bacterium]|nr:hypothetical protein [candidate division WOR-3 bacterium]